ncbi:hypothetical protein D3C74_482230 [compost metagenome]
MRESDVYEHRRNQTPPFPLRYGWVEFGSEQDKRQYIGASPVQGHQQENDDLNGQEQVCYRELIR